MKRERSRQDSEVGIGGPKFPINGDNCHIGMGFSTRNGCKAQATHAIRPCSQIDRGEQAACLKESRWEELYAMYTRDVRQSSEVQKLAETVAQAEGGGFGISMSASFKKLKKSKISEHSIAYAIGESGRVKAETIQSPQYMSLTGPAKQTLKRNVSDFFSRYGMGYISTVDYGGSFLGSFTIRSLQSSDQRDIESFAKISGFWSTKGSKEFQSKRESKESFVDISADARYVGGKGIKTKSGTPEKLKEMFEQWQQSYKEHPAPLTVQTRPWIEISEVQEIVNTMSSRDRKKFKKNSIGSNVQRELGKEHAKVMLIDHSIEQSQSWNGVDKACLKNLERRVSSKITSIEALDDWNVLNIQQQIEQGNWKWFKSDAFQTEFEQCIKDARPPTTTTTTQATTAYCVGDARSPHRFKVAQGANCDGAGWRHKLAYYASSAQGSGLTAYCVGDAGNPHRFKISQGAKCNGAGWTHKFTFYASPTRGSGLSPHCIGYAHNPLRFKVSQSSNCNGGGWTHSTTFYAAQA